MADTSPLAGPYFAVIVHNRGTQPVLVPVHVASRDEVSAHLDGRVSGDADGSFTRYWLNRGRLLVDLAALLSDETALRDALLRDASVRALYELGRQAGLGETHELTHRLAGP